MSSKTKIVVLHMKELIYTGLFLLLAILFIILLIIMFVPGKERERNAQGKSSAYVPGVYTSTLLLNNSSVEIEVVVDEENINSIRLNQLDEAVTTMYPLIEPSFEDLTAQIYETQSLSDITFPEDTKYTSSVLLDAIRSSLDRATVSQNSSER